MDTQALLKKYKVKVTPSRELVLSVFAQEHNPLSAEAIYERLKNKKIDRVTVYRNVTALTQAGVLRKVDLHSSATHYEPTDKHHHHIICNKCGNLEDCLVDMCDTGVLKELSQKILRSSKKFKSINEHSLEFFGMCKSCTLK